MHTQAAAPTRTLLLTGASGFVGGAVRDALADRGWRVRCLTRDAVRARAAAPGSDWVQGDVADADDCAAALQGCQAALYLVHGIGEGADYHAREVAAATTFARAAAGAGVERIVYLGGVAPAGPGSAHLRSRLEVGEALRRGPVKTLELRASMIVGHGSLSWLIVRDLAARLPVMVLPRWLASRTQPVAIDDVVVALVRALDLPLAASAWFDLPGPETLSGREILERSACAMGLPRPRMIAVPLLSPRLSSLWVRFVTRARWSVAREVVVGLTEDLIARDDTWWSLVDHPRRATFADAAGLAIDAARRTGAVLGAWGAVERARGRLRAAPAPASSRGMALALACSVGWVVAATSAARLGIWLALGGAAIVFGGLVAALDDDAVSALRPHLRHLVFGAAVGGAMAACTFLLYPLATHASRLIAGDTALLYAAFRAPSRVVAAVALAPVILGEELVWRGSVQAALVRWRGARAGVGLAAVGYAAAHAPLGSPVLALCALACGLVWGALRQASGSLLAAVAAHIVWDALVLLGLPLDAS